MFRRPKFCGAVKIGTIGVSACDGRFVTWI